MNSIVSRVAYRFLLRLHPASFQDEFGAEMLWIFDEEQRGAQGRPPVTRWSNLSVAPTLPDTARPRSVIHHLRNDYHRSRNRPASPPSGRNHVFVDPPESHSVLKPTQPLHRLCSMVGSGSLLYTHVSSAITRRGCPQTHALGTLCLRFAISITPPPQSEKMVSMGRAKSLDNLNASGRLGSNLPVSIALTDCRETPSFSARSAWLQFLSARSMRREFFTCSSAEAA